MQQDTDLIIYINNSVEGLYDRLQAGQVLEAVFALRAWVAELTSWSDETLLISPQAYPPLREMIRILLEHEQGVWCGGCAHLFSQLLQLLGIPAAVYTYGAGEISHETVVFGIQEEQDFCFYIADAYLGYHYVDTRTDKLMPVRVLLELLRKKQYQHIWRVDENFRRHALIGRDQDMRQFPWLYPGRQVPDAQPRTCGDRLVYANATLSMDGLLLPTSPFRQLVDTVIREGQSLEEFMLEMMLINPTFGRMGFGSGFAYAEYAFYRGIIQALSPDKPDWASKL